MFTNVAPILGTSITAVGPTVGRARLTYQLLNGVVQQKLITTPGQKVETEDRDFGANTFTPTASLLWESEDAVRVFCLDKDNVIQEYCCGKDQKTWTLGTIGEKQAKADPTAGIAATVFFNNGQVEIRVYYQARDPGHQGINYTDAWERGKLGITDALAGTNLAAVTYGFGGFPQTHVFYQHHNLTLKDYVNNNSSWKNGTFSTSKVTGRTPLSALCTGAPEAQVYWRDASGEVARAVYGPKKGWTILEPILHIGSVYQFTVLFWKGGKKVRLYYRNAQGQFWEHCSDDEGKNWAPGIGPF